MVIISNSLSKITFECCKAQDTGLISETNIKTDLIVFLYSAVCVPEIGY